MKFLTKRLPDGPSYELTRTEMCDPRSVRNLSIDDSWAVLIQGCWVPIREFLRSERNSTEWKKSGEREQVATTCFSCVTCGAELRVRIRESLMQCPNCKSSYRVTRIHHEPQTFLIIPQHAADRKESAMPRQPRSVPPVVKAALAVLGLEESADFAEAHTAYKKLVQSYHPDKVAHLGPELKRVAEKKTKELNMAISTIKAFQHS